MSKGYEQTHFSEKHAKKFSPATKQTPSQKNAEHCFFDFGEKRCGTQKTTCGKQHHAARLLLVVKKTEIREMCASATFHHLFFAFVATALYTGNGTLLTIHW